MQPTTHDIAADNLINLLQHEGIRSKPVLTAMRLVPRHLFVNPAYEEMAYNNHPLPIGYQQTISQPYVVARMTEEIMRGKQVKRVLEIGTGSGYQAAVLSHLVDDVYSIERIKPLFDAAQARFAVLNITNVYLAYGDGSHGWPENAPFDGIIVTAAALEPPEQLLQQLAEGGRMIIPLGRDYQVLYSITRQGNQYKSNALCAVAFVPLLSGIDET